MGGGGGVGEGGPGVRWSYNSQDFRFGATQSPVGNSSLPGGGGGWGGNKVLLTGLQVRYHPVSSGQLF